MWFGRKNLIISVLVIMLLGGSVYDCEATFKRQRFIVKEAEYTRLCETKKILTVNGKFPGPTLYANKGDTIFVDVYNQGNYNITIHWHGVRLPRYPWSDGPDYVTQCPIMPGGKFRQKVVFSSEEGTLFWHAHSDWSRATVHGAIIVYPKLGTHYPFPQPYYEFPIILGEWWKRDVMAVLKESKLTGGAPEISDAYTINGQPGDLYPCCQNGTYNLNVHKGKTYLLRIINAALNDILFFAIANHKLTVVGADASYTKPITTDYVTIAPGQTLDALLHANKDRGGRYYMAAKAFTSNPGVDFNNSTTTAILRYYGNYTESCRPSFPRLPEYNDTSAAFNFSAGLRSLASKRHPVYVPSKMTHRLVSTLSINTFPCANNSCAGPNGSRLAASMNNISFVSPSTDILLAYYARIMGVFTNDFPEIPPLIFNFTDEYQPLDLLTPEAGTRVLELDYGSTVELVLQGTSLVAGLEHPMHLHGYSFFIVGSGFGNFDKNNDPLGYNLVDPPYRNTATVPGNGWTAIRFNADNPGVWFIHCHLERHKTWGMDAVLIVRNGPGLNQTLLPPPSYMPPC